MLRRTRGAPRPRPTLLADEQDCARKGEPAHGMPRLTANLDLTFLTVGDREDSLRATDLRLRRIATAIGEGIPGCHARVVPDSRTRMVRKVARHVGRRARRAGRRSPSSDRRRRHRDHDTSVECIEEVPFNDLELVIAWAHDIPEQLRALTEGVIDMFADCAIWVLPAPTPSRTSPSTSWDHPSSGCRKEQARRRTDARRLSPIPHPAPSPPAALAPRTR